LILIQAYCQASKPMMRRVLQIATLFSTIGFIVVGLCLVRERFGKWFRQDQIIIYRLNPSTLRFTDTFIGLDPSGEGLLTQSAVALPTDNLSLIRATIGRSNWSFVHNVYPASGRADHPLLWGDHYPCTPEWGINQNGLASTWVLEFRYAAALPVLGILPAFWLIEKVRRMIRKSAAGHGFPIEPSTVAPSERGKHGA
jgi:hypothetical protein